MRARRVLLPFLLALPLLGASARTGMAQPAALGGETELARGARLFVEQECVRCHAVSGRDVAPAPRARSCAGCHAWIAGTRREPSAYAEQYERFPMWDRYVENVASFLAVPDLGVSAARLDPAWIARYLRAPYDVRPGLPESMIRTTLGETDARAIAAWLTAARPPLAGVAREAAAIPVSQDPAHVAAGAALYARNRCASCHSFGARAATPGIPAAPDLSHARDRMRPGDIAAYLADPSAFGRGGTMPDHGLTALEAARLRDYLLAAPVDRGPAASVPADLPLLTRPVSWDEVNEAVFARVCVHCHMNPATEVDGGPGNTGGLGYAGAGLDLSSWEGTVRGAVENGARVSILEPAPGRSESRLLVRLRARHVEAAAEQSARAQPGGDPGMPLGLPPVDPETMQLLRSWISQGAPYNP